MRDLNDLAILARVAERLSFEAAARDLGLSASTISRRGRGAGGASRCAAGPAHHPLRAPHAGRRHLCRTVSRGGRRGRTRRRAGARPPRRDAGRPFGQCTDVVRPRGARSHRRALRCEPSGRARPPEPKQHPHRPGRRWRRSGRPDRRNARFRIAVPAARDDALHGGRQSGMRCTPRDAGHARRACGVALHRLRARRGPPVVHRERRRADRGERVFHVRRSRSGPRCRHCRARLRAAAPLRRRIRAPGRSARCRSARTPFRRDAVVAGVSRPQRCRTGVPGRSRTPFNRPWRAARTGGSWRTSREKRPRTRARDDGATRHERENASGGISGSAQRVAIVPSGAEPPRPVELRANAAVRRRGSSAGRNRRRQAREWETEPADRFPSQCDEPIGNWSAAAGLSGRKSSGFGQTIAFRMSAWTCVFPPSATTSRSSRPPARSSPRRGPRRRRRRTDRARTIGRSRSGPPESGTGRPDSSQRCRSRRGPRERSGALGSRSRLETPTPSSIASNRLCRALTLC